MDHGQQSIVPFIQQTFCLPAFSLLVAKAIAVCLGSVTVHKLGVFSYKKNAFYNYGIKTGCLSGLAFHRTEEEGEESL